MKLFKKWSSIFAFVLIVTLVTPVTSQLGIAAITQAATVSISQKTLSLEVGKSKSLKISGTNKKATWTSSEKAVAVVSSTGKVTAKKVGSSVITATVDKKKYTCKVTVKKALVANPLIKNAPFKAQETTHSKLKFIIPTTWKQVLSTEQGDSGNLIFLPADADEEKGSSNVSVSYTRTGEKKIDYNILKPLLEESVTADLITSQLAQEGMTVTVKDFKVSDSKTKLGMAFKIEYTVDLGTAEFTQTIYELFIDNYNLEIAITDMGEKLSPDLNTVADYFIETLVISK